MGNASGTCNQSHWSQEEELIIYWSHTLFSVAPPPISNTAASVPIPLFFNFLISAISRHPSPFLFFKSRSLPNLIFFLVCDTSEEERFLPFLVRWQRITEGMLQFEDSPGLWFLRLYCYITTALGMGDYCQMRRLGAVYLPAWWLLWCSLGQRGYMGASEVRAVWYASQAARACCSASWLDSLTHRLVRRIRKTTMAMSGCCPFLLQSDVWEEVKHTDSCANKHTETHTQMQQTERSQRSEYGGVHRETTSDLWPQTA